MSAKITKSTFKSFLKKNSDKLLITTRSSFDGMVDGCTACSNREFTPARKSDLIYADDNTMGIAGVWLVGSSRDYFTAYEKDGITGIDVSNCCGHFIVGIAN